MMGTERAPIGEQRTVPDRRSLNRSMFWRVLRRSAFANRGRLFVILLALGAGSAVTAALLNLQIDAKRRITTEFRLFGANVIVSAREPNSRVEVSLAPALLDKVPDSYEGGEVTKVGFTYVSVIARALDQPGQTSGSRKSLRAILVGLDGHNVQRVLPSEFLETSEQGNSHIPACRLGQVVARQLDVHPRQVLELRSEAIETLRLTDIESPVTRDCYVSTVESFGGAEDSQIFTDWYTAQQLADLPGRLSLIQLSVPGTPTQLQSFIATLQSTLPDANVNPVRQFTEGEARLYSKISGILTATVAVVLVLTALCVMAAMTNIAAERKNDVGLMKAIGGSVRRVLRIFLAEAALLGLAAGLIGAVAGIVLSIGLGKAVFGVAAQPRLIVYPVSVALTVIVAILAAYPLRRLVHIRPASVFRGEE
jgi:putative ABC transport system permease protein